MRRITDFIVEKRYLVLTLVIILAIISLFASSKVKINRDITKYLPSDSSVRIGMDIMEEEFKTKSSSLNVMFLDLEKNKQEQILKEIESIKDVDEVDMHTKDNYTLYEITTDLEKDSKKASVLYDDIMDKYQDYKIETSGDISDENKQILPSWLVPLAVFCALIILIIMSESYVEPFLFLASILIAVLFNKGTNIFFPSISSITDSIVSILQLALSMDYSIMLINRYRQEKEGEKDNIKAMKKALHYSFKAISSSSITTIVGLLALVFMSFKIGLDLGVVLAKGVLFSLLAIFTTLPALILMFDKLINKTKKKSFTLKLDFLGRFAYKFRYVGIILLLIILGVSFLLKGNLTIFYTSTEDDEVGKVFTPNNLMAIVYQNKEEAKMANLCQKLAKDKKVDEVLCYANTLNEPLKYQELNNKLKDFGHDEDIDDYLLKIVYYNYYHQNQSPKLTFNEFISFIKNNVYQNLDLQDEIDSQMRGDIDRLENFTYKETINKERSIKEIANIFELNEKDVEDLLIYYHSLNNNRKLTILEFINFLNNYVLQSEYKDNINSSSKTMINKLLPYLNKDNLNTLKTTDQMAEFLGVDVNLTDNLYLYYLYNSQIDSKMSFQEFASTLINSPYYATLDEDVKTKITVLQTFSNQEFITKQNTITESVNILKIDEEIITQLYGASYLVNNKNSNIEEYTLSLSELISFIYQNEEILASIPKEYLSSLENIAFIINSSMQNTTYNYQEMAQALNLKEEDVKNIYLLNQKDNVTLTPVTFINFILEHQNDEMVAPNLTKENIDNILFIKKVMDSTLNDTLYSPLEMSKLFNIDQDNLKLLYSLYDIKYQKTTISLSYYDFVNFLINNVMNNSKYSASLTDDKITKIQTVNKIMNNALNDVKYTSSELMGILTLLSDDIDKNLIDVLYIYYGSQNTFDENSTLTVEEFVNYLNDDILKDQRFIDFIEDDMRNDIIKAKKDVKEAKDMLVTKDYSRVVINSKYNLEDKESLTFVKNLLKDIDNENIYLIGSTPMAYEMSQSFEGELNLITILTIVFIFVVVCITFKSFLIPAVLVLIIQTAVYTTMGILSFEGGTVYFIALLIVQSILMGATIDYAILYTSYYKEERKKLDLKQSLISAYNKSIHTILTSASILIIVTLIVGHFSKAITSKICTTISQGTLCSTLLILFILPMIIAALDRFITKKRNTKK